MTPVEFSPKAESDLEAIADFIADDNPRRAVSFIREIRDRCRNLSEFPKAAPRFPDLGPDARFMPHGSYVILFNVHGDRVRIERVLHGARDILGIIDGEGGE